MNFDQLNAVDGLVNQIIDKDDSGSGKPVIMLMGTSGFDGGWHLKIDFHPSDGVTAAGGSMDATIMCISSGELLSKNFSSGILC